MGEACSKVSPSHFQQPQAFQTPRPRERIVRVESKVSGRAEASFGPTGETGDDNMNTRRNWGMPNRGTNTGGPQFAFIRTPKSQFGLSETPSHVIPPKEHHDDASDSSDDNRNMKKPLHQESKHSGKRLLPTLLKKNSQEPQILSFFKLKDADLDCVDGKSQDQGDHLPVILKSAKHGPIRSLTGQTPRVMVEELERTYMQPNSPSQDELSQRGSGVKEVSSRLILTNRAGAFEAASGSDLGVPAGQRLHTHQSTNNSSLAGPNKQDSITQVGETPRKPSFEEGSQRRFAHINGSRDPLKRVPVRSGRPIIKIVDDTSVNSTELEQAREVSPIEGSRVSNALNSGISASRRAIAVTGLNPPKSRRKSPVTSAKKQAAVIDRDLTTAEPASQITATLSTKDPEGSFKNYKVPQNSAQVSRLAGSSLQSSLVNGAARSSLTTPNLHLSDKPDLLRSKLHTDTEAAKLQTVSSNNLGNSRFLKSWVAEASKEKPSRIRPIEEEKSFIYHSIGSLEDFSDVLNSKWTSEHNKASANLFANT